MVGWFCRFIDLQGSQTATRVKKSIICFVGLSIYKVLKPDCQCAKSAPSFVGLSIYKVLKLVFGLNICPLCFVGLSIYKVLKPSSLNLRITFGFVGLSIYKVLKQKL